MYSAEVILDSLNPWTGDRLTTIVCTYPLYIHAEMLTHRVFSRNTASSRAIPTAKLIKSVLTNPVVPLEWGRNGKGMVSKSSLKPWKAWLGKQVWHKARYPAIGAAWLLSKLGVHKQWANRIVGPWLWTTCIITATDWEGFFRLRIAWDTQPEMRRIATLMLDRMAASQPVERRYHIPYVTPGETGISPHGWMKLSAARCARVSYTKQGESHSNDMALAEKLRESGHWTPFEHQAQAMREPGRCRNLQGWRQFRDLLEGEHELYPCVYHWP